MKLYLKGDYTKRVPYGYLELAGKMWFPEDEQVSYSNAGNNDDLQEDFFSNLSLRKSTADKRWSSVPLKAAWCLNGADLVAGGLDRAGLMDVDVAGVRGDHALPRAKRGVDDLFVGDCAADHKVHVRLRAGKARTDDAARLGAEIVHAVAAGRDKVIFLKCGEHLRVRALGIIVAERDHGKARPYFRFCSDCRTFR